MDWSRGRTIGRGSSATVYAAFSKTSGQIFAVKSIEFSHSDSLRKEQSILSILTHPRIVGYIGHNTSSENHKLVYNLFIEFLPGGTLNDEILRRGGRLNEQLIALYSRQILEGLDHLHSVGIAHCDIKGQNILVGDDGAKIADFDCAKWVQSPASVETTAYGTPMFMSPEVARGEEQSFPADIWAFGCTIIQMATGGPPWSSNADDLSPLLYRIGFSDDSPKIPDFLSDKAKDFLGKCFCGDPKQRWTSKELLKHPFVDVDQDSNFPNKERNFISPTSIFDLNLWNSVEEISGAPSPSSESQRCFSVGRIRLLTSHSGEPNWTDEEDWMTVRDK